MVSKRRVAMELSDGSKMRIRPEPSRQLLVFNNESPSTRKQENCRKSKRSKYVYHRDPEPIEYVPASKFFAEDEEVAERAVTPSPECKPMKVERRVRCCKPSLVFERRSETGCRDSSNLGVSDCKSVHVERRARVCKPSLVFDRRSEAGLYPVVRPGRTCSRDVGGSEWTQ